MERRRSRRILRLVFLAVPAAVLFIAAVGFVVMSLWNALLPALFGWKAIGYWQAIGLMILGRLLFGGFRGAGGRGGHWRHRMMERCEQMTPEERERFRQAFYDRWGRVAPEAPKPSA